MVIQTTATKFYLQPQGEVAEEDRKYLNRQTPINVFNAIDYLPEEVRKSLRMSAALWEIIDLMCIELDLDSEVYVQDALYAQLPVEWKIILAKRASATRGEDDGT